MRGAPIITVTTQPVEAWKADINLAFYDPEGQMHTIESISRAEAVKLRDALTKALLQPEESLTCNFT